MISFATPALLLSLIVLPAIWYLIRIVPPKPNEIIFPPLILLQSLKSAVQTPAHSPWWLTLLRLVLASLLIFALAGPSWNNKRILNGASGPVLLVMDVSWSTADEWETRLRIARDIIDEADQNSRHIALLTTAMQSPLQTGFAGAHKLINVLATLTPEPLPANRKAFAQLLATNTKREDPFSEIAWISDGHDDETQLDFENFDGNVHIWTARSTNPAITDVSNGAEGMKIEVTRATGQSKFDTTITGNDQDGRTIASTRIVLNQGQLTGTAILTIPLELRNEIASLSLKDQKTAGSLYLLDGRWSRRKAGILPGSQVREDQPLLSAAHYISNALAPVATLLSTNESEPYAAFLDMVENRPSLLLAPDMTDLSDALVEDLKVWISNGGTLVRFAGDATVSAPHDELMPVKLLGRSRTLGGALTWEQPRSFAGFEKHSPFAGLPVYSDIRIEKQILAEPGTYREEQIWARLDDGTPIVSGKLIGRGMLVFFHTSARPDWSNLSFSGTFVHMLQRLNAISRPATTSTRKNSSPGSNNQNVGDVALQARMVINNSGALISAKTATPPIRFSTFDTSRAGVDRPAGIYRAGHVTRSLNLFTNRNKPVAYFPDQTKKTKIITRAFSEEHGTDLRPIAYLSVLFMFFLDILALIYLAGGIHRWKTSSAVIAIIIFSTATVSLSPIPVTAQETLDIERALKATSKPHIAFVKTGNPDIDRISRSGLAGLSQLIAARTAMIPGSPMSVDPERDELAFFPLIYWPVYEGTTSLSKKAIRKVRYYMENGGTILFDTRDANAINSGNNTPAKLALRRLLEPLGIPALEPVRPNHVLTKSFYLLSTFPGRWSEGMLWTEAFEPASGNPVNPHSGDGVSPVLITNNDMAAAWAVDQSGRPLLPVETANPRQREWAYRAGINIVMYAFTGNYKGDQVHLPALLERLSQ